MDRRNFLKSTGTILAASAVAPGMPAFADDATPEAKGRVMLPFNRRWRYSPRATEDARERQFDDSSFARVTIPHTNVRLPWHSFDDKAYEFVSIYRRHFRLPGGAKTRRVFVDFEGVMTASTVFLNGTKLGEYRGGFTPFSFELTQHLDWDGDNVLAVEADSTERADIPPFGYEIDYLTFGGIYREVSLRLVAPTFLENIFAQPKDVLTDHALSWMWPAFCMEPEAPSSRCESRRRSALRPRFTTVSGWLGRQRRRSSVAPDQTGRRPKTWR